MFCVFSIGVADDELPDAMLPTSVVPSCATSSIIIQYLRVPVPAVLLANKLFTHSPGIIVVVRRSTCTVTKVATRTSPSVGDRPDIVILDCVVEFGTIRRLSTIGGDIGTVAVLFSPS